MEKSRMHLSELDPSNEMDRRAIELHQQNWETVLPPRGAKELIEVLNGKRLTVASKQRVERILTLLQKWQAFRAYIGWKWGGGKTNAEIERLNTVVSNVPGDTGDIYRLLSQYWVSPRILPVNGSPRIGYLVRAKGRNAESHKLETGLVMCLLHLSMTDELDRVGKCDCGQFFFANRVDQRYCSTRCRVRFHQASDEFKAKRRIKARKIYELKHTSKVKQ
jgi:hypothetical protein